MLHGKEVPVLEHFLLFLILLLTELHNLRIIKNNRVAQCHKAA